MDSRMFDAQVQALAPGFRVTRWDARGFGHTRWDGKPVAAMNNLIDRDDIQARLGDIHCPALVFHGTDDTGIPPSEGELLHKTLPGSKRLVLVPGAAHAANLTHPEAVNPPLVEFLRAHA
jgi:pimeloyl-ACP methyl ester carboxylesterase